VSEKLYEVVYVDKFDDLLAAELFRDQVRKRFRLDTDKLSRLSTGLPVVVKKRIQYDEAQRYHAAIRKAGGICWVQELGPNGEHFERRENQRRRPRERRGAYRASSLFPDRRGRDGRRTTD
jgi:hypothetical protein